MISSTRSRIATALLIAVAASLVYAADKPNVLFIYLDDFGWRDTSYMGSDFYETPHLDKLASKGMIFTDAYSAAANCAPARACLLSGQYTPRHEVYNVGTRNGGGARVRLQQRGENRDGGGLARAVGSEDAEHRPDRDGEVEPVESDDVAVSVDEVVRRMLGGIETDDVGVVERPVRQVGCQLVEDRPVGGHEPLCQRPVNEDQQHADKTQRDQAVTLLLLFRFQRRRIPFSRRKV